MGEGLMFDRSPCAIFLCDVTGNMARPWAEAGIDCFCVDVQHPFLNGRTEGRIRYVWGDARTWRPPETHRPIFVFAFPPCTNVSVSGARHFVQKGGQSLRDALETFEACRQAAAWSGAPYGVENPVGVLSSIPHIGKPNHYFHPSDYAGWHADDNYTKKTCIWSGNGFVMPDKRPLIGAGPPDDRIHKTSPGQGRGDIRSETPMGFSLATFDANAPVWLRARKEVA